MISHIYAFLMCLALFWLPVSAYMIKTHMGLYKKHEGSKKVDWWHHRRLAFRWLIVFSVCCSWLLPTLLV